MINESAPTHRELGWFQFEVFSSGRGGRSCVSRFKVECDAIGLHEKEILLLSVVGSETGVKALTAGLRSSGRDQKRYEYKAHLGSVNETYLTKCPSGYRVYRAKLEYDLWHVLCLAKRDGFMPVITDETIWRLLQGERFTTPLLREWTPWLSKEMKQRGVIVELNQHGCEAGLMIAESDTLDELVSDGIRKKQLVISGPGTGEYIGRKTTKPARIESLEDYLLAHGSLLGKQAERSLDPLHAPGATIANLATLGHTRCRRPIFPLDPDVAFHPVVERFTRSKR